jgi:hypothetical protein
LACDVRSAHESVEEPVWGFRVVKSPVAVETPHTIRWGAKEVNIIANGLEGVTADRFLGLMNYAGAVRVVNRRMSDLKQEAKISSNDIAKDLFTRMSCGGWPSTLSLVCSLKRL